MGLSLFLASISLLFLGAVLSTCAAVVATTEPLVPVLETPPGEQEPTESPGEETQTTDTDETTTEETATEETTARETATDENTDVPPNGPDGSTPSAAPASLRQLDVELRLNPMVLRFNYAAGAATWLGLALQVVKLGSDLLYYLRKKPR